MKRVKRRKLFKKIVSIMLVIVMILSVVVVNPKNVIVAEAATYYLTEEQLFLQAPLYLYKSEDEEFFSRAFMYADEALESVSRDDTLISSVLYSLKDGSSFLIRELGSQLGLNDSTSEKLKKELAMEVLNEFFCSKVNTQALYEKLVKKWSTFTTIYKAYDEINKDTLLQIMPANTDYTSDELLSIFDVEVIKKINDRLKDSKAAYDTIVNILFMQQMQMDAIDELISIYDGYSEDICYGLRAIKKDIKDDIGLYILNTYCKDWIIDKIASAANKELFAAASASSMYTVVKAFVTVFNKIWELEHPSVSELMKATVMHSYAYDADRAVQAMQAGFVKGTLGKDDIDRFETAYYYYTSCVKLYLKKAAACSKEKPQIKEEMETMASAINTQKNYNSYLLSCLKIASEDIRSGRLKISGSSVVITDKNGTVIDENYDSTESITAKLAEIQKVYKPNVGQTWTASYKGSIQCNGFARLVFNKLFGYDISGYVGNKRYMLSNEGNVQKVGQLIGNDVTVDNVKKLFANAKIGDYIQVNGSTFGQHSMIFVGLADDGIIVYDCNWKPHGEKVNCLINQWTMGYSYMVSLYSNPSSASNNGISVYRANNYASIYGDGDDLFYDDSVNFVIQDGVLTKYNGFASYVIIPDTVTAIGNNAFKGNTAISYVEIPNTVTSIGDSAFYGCTSLASVFIPDSVETIGSSAFYKCSSLASARLPINEKFEKLNSSVFYQCGELEKVNIPDSVTSIGNEAFYNCNNLVDVDLPGKLVSLGYAVFTGTSITSITIPKSLETATSREMMLHGEWKWCGPFGQCEKLSKINFEEGITQIPSYLFVGAIGLEEIEIPSTVTKINSCAFEYCDNLKSAKIPESVTSIGTYAFSNCITLSKVVIPDSVTSIGNEAFYNCNNLVDVDLPGKLVSIGYAVFTGTSITSITIPKSLETATSREMMLHGEWKWCGPFGQCEKLSKINFEEGITQIPSYLFVGAIGLEEIEIPSTVTKINSCAFEYCDNLKSAKIPKSVTSIGSSAFAYCSKLTTFDIPIGVGSIVEYTFSSCSNLKEVNLPDTLETIGNSAFYGCASLTEITIPDKVNSIGSSAFYSCTSLEKFTAGKGLKTINSSAFYKDTALTDVTLNEGITKIDTKAFEYCSALESIKLPNTLTSLGTYAFAYCDELKNIDFGAGIKTIPSYCFYEDPKLTEAILPQQVTTVNEFAFGNCTSFNKITANRNVTSMKINAFSYPAKLTMYGIAGTYAQDFAFDNDIAFVELDKPATDIILNKTAVDLPYGSTMQLIAAMVPVNSSDELTWTSTDDSIVTVSDTGVIKGIAGGDATIIAMAGDVIVTCDVHVYKAVTSVYLSKSSVSAHIGESYTLTATVNPSDAANKKVIWSSSDTSVATVKNGVVTIVGLGTAKITATADDNGKSASCTFTVTSIPVTGLSLNTTKLTLDIGATGTLSANITPSNADNKEVTWTSSKPAVATVENGVVKAVSAGTAIIVVKTKDGSKTASCTVTVSANVHTHSWDGGKVTKASSCIAKGEKTFTCTSCGEIKTEAIALAGHSYKTTTTKATTVKNGSIVKTCSVCGETGSTTTIYFPKTVTLSTTSTAYTGSAIKPTVTVKDSAGNTISASNYTVSYTNNTAVGTATVKVTFSGNYSGYISKTFKINPKTTTIGAPAIASDGITVKWSKNTSGAGYYIYRSVNGASYTKVKTITSNATVSWKDTTAKTNGNKYQYKIVAYKTVNGTTYSSAASAVKTIYFLTRPTVTLANQASAIKVSWGKNTKANGYYVYKSTDGGSSYKLIKTITSNATVSYTDTAAKTNGTKYMYKVIAYKTVSGTTYKSAESTVKTMYFVSRPAISSATNSAAGKLLVKWARNAKATGYEIQYSTSSSFASPKSVTATGTASTLSKTIASLTKGKTYYVRIRSYKTVGSTKYYSTWSASKSVKITR